MMKTLREEIKNRVFSTGESRTTTVERSLVDSMQQIASSYNFRFDREQVSAAALPNGEKSILAYTWMIEHFNLIGDYEPAKE